MPKPNRHSPLWTPQIPRVNLSALFKERYFMGGEHFGILEHLIINLRPIEFWCIYKVDFEFRVVLPLD